jgi:hypothetical protein
MHRPDFSGNADLVPDGPTCDPDLDPDLGVARAFDLDLDSGLDLDIDSELPFASDLDLEAASELDLDVAELEPPTASP